MKASQPITFLSSTESTLTKTYELNKEGEIEKRPYPNVYRFSSTTKNITSIKGLYTELEASAKKGECLLKGKINKKLVNEPRKGSTRSEDETCFVCFDLDKVTGIHDVDHFLKLMGLNDVSHIIQFSSSYGIEYKKKALDERLSCHIFMWLEEPVAAPLLKQWLIQKNFEIPELERDLELTASKNALRYGLDITTCQNDKLLYIAPPLCNKGIIDKLGENRIKFVQRENDAFKFEVAEVNPISKNRKLIDDKKNELRRQAGLDALPKSVFKTNDKLNVEYMTKPDQATVTGVKHDRGFIYLNLNGGDSWGYYFPEDAPEVLFNFKGEPNYLLKEICPSFYASFKRDMSETKNASNQDALIDSKRDREEGKKYLAFRDFQTGSYWNGWYDGDKDELMLRPAKSEKQLRDFMAQYNLDIGDFVPDWSIVYDPHSEYCVDSETKVINTYKPSPFASLPLRKPGPTPVINKVIAHMLAVDDVENPTEDELFVHFINWLAFIIQKKQRAQTAWVLQGCEGTGKGTLFNKIIRPMLGETNCTSRPAADLESINNGWMFANIVAFIDEAHIAQAHKSKAISARIRNWITEPTTTVQDKYERAREVTNYNSFIFASNQRDSVVLPETDRRHNVANYQECKLLLSDKEYKALDTEVVEFYMYLAQYKVNESQVRQVINTEAREHMMRISRSSFEEVSKALRTGDLMFFIDNLPDNVAALDTMKRFQLDSFKEVVKQWLERARDSKPNILRDDLHAVMMYITTDIPNSPHKFSSMMKHYGVMVKQASYNGRLSQVVHVRWQDYSQAEFDIALERMELDNPLKRKEK